MWREVRWEETKKDYRLNVGAKETIKTLQIHHFAGEESGSLSSAKFHPSVYLLTSEPWLALFSSLCPNLELSSIKTWFNKGISMQWINPVSDLESPDARSRVVLCCGWANRQDPWGLELACSAGSGRKTRGEWTAETGKCSTQSSAVRAQSTARPHSMSAADLRKADTPEELSGDSRVKPENQGRRQAAARWGRHLHHREPRGRRILTLSRAKKHTGLLSCSTGCSSNPDLPTTGLGPQTPLQADQAQAPLMRHTQGSKSQLRSQLDLK